MASSSPHHCTDVYTAIFGTIAGVSLVQVCLPQAGRVAPSRSVDRPTEKGEAGNAAAAQGLDLQEHPRRGPDSWMSAKWRRKKGPEEMTP